MLRFLLTLGLLAACAIAQGQDSPPRPPPPAPGGPAPAGGDMDDHHDDHEHEEEPCPPRTGREWICMIDYWDPNTQRVIESEERMKCDMRDMCYLGPVVSRSLNEPWQRKWMCGPRPCRYEGVISDGRMMEGMHECEHESDTCDLGPEQIMVNGTRVDAWFCRHHDEGEDGEMHDHSDEPHWAPEICTLDSSLHGHEELHDCPSPETCQHGPIDFYHNGTQYRAFMCTHTKGKMPHHWRSHTEELMYHIDYDLQHVAEELIMHGHVMYDGTHVMIHDLQDHLHMLMPHIEWAENRSKEMHEDELHLPDYVRAMWDPIHIEIVAIQDAVETELGIEMGRRMLSRFRRETDELYVFAFGIPTIREEVHWLHESLEYLAHYVHDSEQGHDHDLHSFETRVAFRSAKEFMLELYRMIHNEPGVGPALMVLERMTHDMSALWNMISYGPVMPGLTRMEIERRITADLHDLEEAMAQRQTPEERAEEIHYILMHLEHIAEEEGKVNGKEAMEYFRHLHEMVVSFRRWIDHLENHHDYDHYMEEVEDHKMQLWAIISVAPDATTTDAIGVIHDLDHDFELLLDAIHAHPPRERRPMDGPMGDGPGPMGGGGPGPMGGGPMGDSPPRPPPPAPAPGRGGNGMQVEPRNAGERALHDAVEHLRALHDHVAHIREIPKPTDVAAMLLEDLVHMADELRDHGDDVRGGRLGQDIQRVRQGVMELIAHLMDPTHGDPEHAFGVIIDNLEDMVRYMRDHGYGDREFFDHEIEELESFRRMDGGGRGGGQQQGPGGQGGNDDMRRQLADLQRTVNNMMGMMDGGRGGQGGQNGDHGDHHDDHNGGGGDRYPQMMAMMDHHEGEDECPGPFWEMQIGEDHMDEYAIGAGAYMGHEDEPHAKK